jgi:hypothetical protein
VALRRSAAERTGLLDAGMDAGDDWRLNLPHRRRAAT